MLIFGKMKRVARSFLDWLSGIMNPLFPLPPQDRQKAFRASLIAEAAKRFNAAEQVIHSDWQKNVMKLRTDIINNDPIDFINWSVVRGTMFHVCSIKELEA